MNYIYQNKKEFLNFINQTFKEYTLTKNKNNNTKKDLFKYQKFIRKYLSEETPYRGLLVFHAQPSTSQIWTRSASATEKHLDRVHIYSTTTR